MKFVLIIPDGMADYPVEALGNKTPIQFAKTPHMDELAKGGVVGCVHTVPEGMKPGSDVAILNLMGYDPKRYYTGRGPLEASAQRLSFSTEDVIFRCNLIYSDGKVLVDYSGGHIGTEEAKILLGKVSDKLGDEVIRFFPGVSYRHLLVWNGGAGSGVHEINCKPPHDFFGKEIKDVLPEGDSAESKRLRNLIWNSIEILNNHDINKKRRDSGENPANMIWPWGQGKTFKLPLFYEKYEVKGALISAVDLVRGIGVGAGIEVLDVPGITGYYDTDYDAKALYGISALKTFDFLLIHVEATDEAGHNGHLDEKIKAIENVDRKIVGPVAGALREKGEDFRMLILPDHYTPVNLRTHVSDPVPFLLYSSRSGDMDLKHRGQFETYDETAGQHTSLRFAEGHQLMGYFLGAK